MKKKQERGRAWCMIRKGFLIMKLFLLIMILGVLQSTASVYSQTKRFSLSEKNVSIREVLEDIEHQSEFRFFYDEGSMNVNDKLNIDVKDYSINEVLDELLNQKGISYKIMDNNFIVLKMTEAYSLMNQNIKLSGKVTDKSGAPLPGVAVVVKGTTNGTITNFDGVYNLSEVPSDGIIQFSFVGMKMQEIPVEGKTSINLVMEEDAIGIEEVVAVGYGTTRKREVVGAVAKVKSSVIESASTNSIKDVLQGKIAGVDVQSARYPGDDQGILIRGARSLNAGNSPLIIIDGIPGSLSSVNSYDIESIEVLKDAASSAIYGSMGANGVIIVTTKRASKKISSEIDFNSYVGINVPHMVPLQTGEQYAQFRRDGYRNAHGWDNPVTDEMVFSASELDVINKGEYTDWKNLLYRNALTQSHYLSIKNSGEKTRLSLSFKYDKEEGYYKTNERENLNLSLTADHEICNIWTLGTTIRLLRNNNDGFRRYGNEILYMTPLSLPYKENGELNFFPNPLNTSGYNPLANYLPGQYESDSQRNTLNFNLTSDLKITKNLTMKTNFGYIYNGNKSGYFNGLNSYDSKGVKTTSGKSYSNVDQYTLNNILSYDNTFGNHHIIVDLVGEVQNYQYDNSSLSGDNQPVEYTTYNNLETNSSNIKIASGYSAWSLASVLGRLRYNFKDKYFFNIAFREDGSSRLADGNKWAFFPSGGIGWSIKDEDFLQKADWLNSLKLRFSYGTVGNTAISSYQTQATLADYTYLFGEAANDKIHVYRPASIVNLDLGWEVSRTLNGGVDFGFLNNRINGYVEFYQTKTDDLLMRRAIPTFTGFSQIWQNIGKTQNSGFETSLTFKPVKKNDLVIDFNINASRNWEKILELISGEDLPNNRWFIGKPLSVHYDYEKIGIWQLGEETEAAKYNATVGSIKIKDQNNDNIISAADDRIILGQTRPKLIASFGGNLQYKSLDFSFNLNSRWGYLIKPTPYNDITMDGQRWLPPVDYWTPENPTNEYPKADQATGYDTYRSSNGYQKGDHIKLQDITLGYSFKKLLPKQIPVKRARLFIQARNIAYLYKATKFDIIPEAPDVNFTIPASYNLGLNITF